MMTPPSLGALGPDLAPPIIPGFTELPPDRMRAILRASMHEDGDGMPHSMDMMGMEHEQKSDNPLAMVMQYTADAIAKAMELGPQAMAMMESLVRAANTQFQAANVEMEMVKHSYAEPPPLEPMTLGARPPLNGGGQDPRQALPVPPPQGPLQSPLLGMLGR